MSENPKYTIVFPRDVYWAGDTVDGFELKLTYQNTSTPIVPTQVCCQIRNEAGTAVYTYTPTISANGTVTFESVVAAWGSGMYVFDVEYIMANGAKRTYVTGTLPIKGDVSKCQL